MPMRWQLTLTWFKILIMNNLIVKAMKKNKLFLKTVALSLMALFNSSCGGDRIGAPLTVEVKVHSITEYLKANPSYTILVSALDLTGVSASLNLYGAITLFAPTNDAFKKYLALKGIADISKMNVDTLRQLVNYHLYSQKYAAAMFPVSTATVSGDLISMDISNGVRNTLLNGTVKIDTTDISASNGIVHVINDVLKPPKNTIFNYLQGNPNYSIMAEAISKTGLDTALLNKVFYDNTSKIPSKKFVTFFAETNTVLNQQGITSFNDLAKKFSNSFNTTRNYTSKSDSLNIFMRYHCLQRKYFILDFIDDVYESVSSGNWLVIDTKDGVNINRHLEKQSVLNPVSGKYELKEIEIMANIVANRSNIVSSNGIVHSLGNLLKVAVAKPVIVKAYFGGLPQDRVIQMPDRSVVTFIDVFESWKDDATKQNSVWWLKWGWISGSASKMNPINWDLGPNGSDPGSINPRYKADYPLEPMDGLGFSSPIGLWLEITTKPIFPGKYYVYLYEQNQNASARTDQWKFIWSLDGVKNPDMCDLNTQLDKFGNVTQLFNEQKWDNQGGNVNNSILYWPNYDGMKKILLCIATFDNIQPHKVKIEMVDENRAVQFFKIQFEPVQ
jgi:uncharacterized surface protein with fasciclin (FAS1) repeats